MDKAMIYEAVKNVPFAMVGQVARGSDKLPKWVQAMLGTIVLALLPAIGSIGVYWLNVRDDMHDMKLQNVVTAKTLDEIKLQLKDINDGQNKNRDRILKLETEHNIENRHHVKNGDN